MGAISKAIENFIFRSFNPFANAARSEYWIAMPLIWALIFVLIWLDVQMVWEALLAREVPPLSPLAYGSLMAILVTLPARFSLTVRRLNDAGRSPKWVLLPIQAGVLALMGLFGLLTALMTTTVGAGLTLGLVLTLRFGTEADLWPVLWGFAQALEAGLLTDLTGAVDLPSLAQIGTSLTSVIADNPAVGAASTAVLALFTLGPPLLILLFFMFMLMPTRVSHFDDGPGSFGGTARRRDPDRRSAAFAAYAHLERIHGPPEEVDHVARKAEVRALYRQRVLGETPGPEAG